MPWAAAVCAALLAACASAHAADSSGQDPASFMELSLEQLMEVTVTSVARREQKVAEVAAAVTVLSGDSLRRSAGTTVADALRRVPGMNVGALNANQWAVSARGFNGVYSNKLLVLVDGRAVYTPLFAGVHWDLQASMLEDVDRIEVIRGPGATIWGANAVNGVVSLVSRDAAQTQGALIYGGGGDIHQSLAGMRYGGRIGDRSHYRVFGSYSSNDDGLLPNGQPAGDAWEGGNAGFRIDRDDGDAHLTWQADATVSDLDHHASDAHNVNTLLRWKRQGSERSGVEVQAYLDQTARNDANRAHTITDTLDVEAQHSFGAGERHDVIWGMGLRYLRNRLAPTNARVQIRDPHVDQQLYSVFVQDEFRWVPERFAVTAGVKLEHNDFTGLEIQPSLRAAWRPTPTQTGWAAVSRAVRTPSIAEGTDTFAIRVAPPAPGPGGALFTPTLVGNPSLDAEVLWAYELGYRVQPARSLSVDLAIFHNRYTHLISFVAPRRFVPGTPTGTAEIPFENLLSAEGNGGELALTWAPRDAWRVGLAYSLLELQVHGATDLLSLGNSAPRHQVRLHAALDFARRASVDGELRYVDEVQAVSSYVTADLRLAWRPTTGIELSLAGQNLLDESHREQRPQILALASEVPRGIYAKLVWRPR